MPLPPAPKKKGDTVSREYFGERNSEHGEATKTKATVKTGKKK